MLVCLVIHPVAVAIYTVAVWLTHSLVNEYLPGPCKLGICFFDGKLLPSFPQHASHEVATRLRAFLNLDVDPHASNGQVIVTSDGDAALSYHASALWTNNTNSTLGFSPSNRPSVQTCPSPNASCVLQVVTHNSSNSSGPFSGHFDPKCLFGWCKNIFQDAGDRSFDFRGSDLTIAAIAVTVLIVAIAAWIAKRELNIQKTSREKMQAENERSSLMDDLLAARNQTEVANANLQLAEKKCRSLEAEPRVSRHKLIAENTRHKLSIGVIIAFVAQDRKQKIYMGKLCDINRELREELQRVRTQKLEEFFDENADVIIAWLQEQDDRVATIQEEHKRDHDQHMGRRFRLEASATGYSDRIDTYRLMLDEMEAEHAELMRLVPGYQSKLRFTVTEEERKQKEKIFFINERKELLDSLRSNFDILGQDHGTLQYEYNRRGEEYDDLKYRFRRLLASQAEDVRPFSPVA